MNDPAHPRAQQQPLSKQGWFWALLPVALLLATAVGVLSVVSIALDDKGFSVEQDYYKKAVHFDAELLQRRHNSELGWRMQAELAYDKSGATVTLQLRDPSAQPVSGAKLEADAFALARGQRVERLAFVETDPGIYQAKFANPRAGLWELRMSAARGSDRFTQVVRTDAIPATTN